MNIISPFGRLLRRGYLAVVVALIVVIAAMNVVTWLYVPSPYGVVVADSGKPWLRWLIVADPVGCLLRWSLFCAAVKRLHDFRWSGILALPLLSFTALVPLQLAFPLIDYAWGKGYDLPQPFDAIRRIGMGLQYYDLALLIVLAIIPTDRRHLDVAETDAA